MAGAPGQMLASALMVLCGTSSARCRLSTQPARRALAGTRIRARAFADVRMAGDARAATHAGPDADGERSSEADRADYEAYLALTRTPLREVPDGEAQASHVIALEGLLSAEEAALVLGLAEQTALRDPGAVFDRSPWSWAGAPPAAAARAAPHWQVVFLQAGHQLQARLPALAARLKRAAREVDEAQGWNATRGLSDAQLGIRCAEVHRQSAGGGLPDAQHRDHGSLITIDVMLSDSGSFEGGEFSTYDARGRRRGHVFERGTALVFLSLKRHGVTPVRSGVRRVLVLELWQGADVSVAGRDESQRW